MSIVLFYIETGRQSSFPFRFLFEAAPLAFMEHAGGAGTDGLERLCSIQPPQIHHRLPVFLGSKEDIEEIKTYKDVQQNL
jgi:fructose-1,6-bisphosphatase I